MHVIQTIHASIVAFMLLNCLTARAQIEALIDRGNISDVRFQPGEALKDYLSAEKLEPNNVKLLLCIARQYRHLMTDATTSEMKLKIGNISLVYALRAAALAPNNSEAQLSPAISYGKMLPFQGNKEQVTASPRIKVAADKALRLDPSNDVAWHVLGRWHQALAKIGVLKRTLGQLIYGKLPVSTNQEAVVCFNKAIALNPKRLRHYIELGHTYAQMGQNAAARRNIEKGLAMPNLEKDDPDMKIRGRETLAKLP